MVYRANDSVHNHIMRKRHIGGATPKRVRPEDEGWMDMDTSAVIEVSAEQKDYPIDSALLTGEAGRWRAAEPGTQTVRLMFD